jgi:ribosome-associated translation inhibitor RaiA
MQVQVNTGNGSNNTEALERWAEAEIRQALARFDGELARVEVHLTAGSPDKGGASDKRCVMEARLARHDPLAVNHNAPNQDLAFRGASEKLKRVLDHTLGKLRDHHRDRETIRHDAAPDTGTP